MAGIDPAISAWITPLSIGVAAAALGALAACAATLGRTGAGALARVSRVFLVAISAGLCGLLAWTFFESGAAQNRVAERLALQARSAQLTAQSLRPGSPLACLDAISGEAVATACTKTLFATPAGVAAAISYVAAQFALLSDISAYSDRGGTNIGTTVEPLRRALEADPFGILAHVLATRDECTADKCPPLRLLQDASHVRTNLIARTMDRYLDQSREAWAKSTDVPLAELPESAEPTGAVAPNAAGKRKVTVNIDFPSADSIPPVSIMNPEPNGPAEARAGATPEPHKRTEKPAAHEVRQPAAAPPEQDKTDPVWTPAPAQPR